MNNIDQTESHMPAFACPANLATFKWGNRIALRHMDNDDLRLFNDANRYSFRANMAMGVLLSEYMIELLRDHCDVTDARQRIEAAWVSIIEPGYTRSIAFELSDDEDFHEENAHQGALEIVLHNLDSLFERYINGDIWISTVVARQITLASYLSKSSSDFTAWHKTVSDKAAVHFPKTCDYDQASGVFDFSSEAALCPYFFNPSHQYDVQQHAQYLQAFIEDIDRSSNPYLQASA